MTLQGTITALVTPFRNLELDEEGLAANIHDQMTAGIDGIVVLGTTGEAPTLSAIERERVITIAVREAGGRIPVIVGTGSNCTRHTIEMTKTAQDLGADIALVVTPYYNKPTQAGIYAHFAAIASETDIPIILYNIPGRTAVPIETQTLLRLAGLPSIIGVKDSTANLAQVSDIFAMVVSKYPHFRVWSGDDAYALPMIALGASGVVSVVSNLVPAEVAAFIDAALQGDFVLARRLHYRLLPLFIAAFVETNPVPIKAAMELCGLPAGGCRQPLHPLSTENLNTLYQQLLAFSEE